jgi:hypothetical protein
VLTSSLAFVLAFTGPQEVLATAPQPPPLDAAASLYWGDFDGDALEDALAVDLSGRARLLRNRGDGTFEDLSAGSGLAPLQGVTLGAWGDYDADGKLDLFVGRARAGARLFKNLGGGTFEALDSGLTHAAADLAAQWVDYDQDGLADLWIEIESGALVYHNFGATSFELVEMPLAAELESGTGAIAGETTGVAAPETGRFRRPRPGAPLLLPGGATNASLALASGPAYGAVPVGPVGPSPAPAQFCAPGVVDLSTGNCVSAASLPALGKLYPLGPELNIDSSGRVGVNTTSPLYRLHVIESAGTGVFAQGGTTGVRGDANLAGSGNRYGGYFTSSGGSNNIGVFGTSTIAVYGVGTAYGVLGETNSSASVGVYGRANHTSATTTGVLGEASSSAGTGVKGSHLATSGTTPGVHGVTSSTAAGAAGVRGQSAGVGSPAYGVHGTASSSAGTGVFGDGQTGVEGDSSAIDGIGVSGRNLSALGYTTGVMGEVSSPDGIAVTALGFNGSTSSNGAGAVGAIGPIAYYQPMSGVSGGASVAGGYGVSGVTDVGSAGVYGLSMSVTAAPGVAGEGVYKGVVGKTTASSPAVYSGASGVLGLGDTGVIGETEIDNFGGVFGGSAYNGAGTSAGVIGRNAFDVTGWGVLGDDGSGALLTDGPAGVLGVDGRDTGAGVIGVHRSAFGFAPGVEGFTNSEDAGAPGVIGRTTHTTFSDTVGVMGISAPQPFFGIGGDFYGGWYGVRGTAQVSGGGWRVGGSFTASGGSAGNSAVSAYASGANASGIYASAPTGTGQFAGWFSGNVTVSGTLAKGGGSFKIDHPLDPENKYLYHSFVESPDMKNIYDGVAVLDGTGSAWVDLPEWFDVLNRDFRYQLTAIGAPGPMLHVASEIASNRFQIGGGVPGSKVSWQVTGIRKDAFANANRIPVEEDKRPEERGLYLHHEAYGLPREQSIAYVLHEQPMQAKMAPLDATRAAQESLWADQAVKAQESQRWLDRWDALGLPPPPTAVAVPDPDVYLREHPEYREQAKQVGSRMPARPDLRRIQRPGAAQPETEGDK